VLGQQFIVAPLIIQPTQSNSVIPHIVALLAVVALVSRFPGLAAFGGFLLVQVVPQLLYAATGEYAEYGALVVVEF